MSLHSISFDLSIDATPVIVSAVRRFVEDTVHRAVGDREAVFRIAMSAHELFENAAKYSVGSKASLHISVAREQLGFQVTLSIVNDATSFHIDRLRERISAIEASTDPFAHYQTLMRRTAHDPNESGLGLARIRAEAEMCLGLEILGSKVAITATGRGPMNGKASS